MKWLLKIPHPTYGNYGGKGHTSDSLKPIDKMDMYFMIHDIQYKDTPEEKRWADKLLINNLKTVKTKDLYYKFYGNFYKWAAILVFSLIVRSS